MEIAFEDILVFALQGKALPAEQFIYAMVKISPQMRVFLQEIGVLDANAETNNPDAD